MRFQQQPLLLEPTTVTKNESSRGEVLLLLLLLPSTARTATSLLSILTKRAPDDNNNNNDMMMVSRMMADLDSMWVTQEDAWAVISAYFEEKGLVRQQLDSFDQFIQNTTRELVDDSDSIRVSPELQMTVGYDEHNFEDAMNSNTKKGHGHTHLYQRGSEGISRIRSHHTPLYLLRTERQGRRFAPGLRLGRMHLRSGQVLCHQRIRKGHHRPRTHCRKLSVEICGRSGFYHHGRSNNCVAILSSID